MTPSTVVGLARLGPTWPLAAEDSGPLATPAVALLPLLLLMPLLLELLELLALLGHRALNLLVSNARPNHTNRKWLRMSTMGTGADPASVPASASGPRATAAA